MRVLIPIRTIRARLRFLPIISIVRINAEIMNGFRGPSPGSDGHICSLIARQQEEGDADLAEDSLREFAGEANQKDSRVSCNKPKLQRFAEEETRFRVLLVARRRWQRKGWVDPLFVAGLVRCESRRISD